MAVETGPLSPPRPGREDVACPWLGLRESPAAHATSPSTGHRCFVGSAEGHTIPGRHQEEFCLAAEYRRCRVYREGWNEATKPRPRRVWIVLGGLAAVIIGATAVPVVADWLDDDSAAPANVETSSATMPALTPTPAVTATGSATTTTTPTATPTVATATPTPTRTATATPVPTATSPERGPFAAAAQVIDPSRRYVATIRTDRGDIVIRLFADMAPRTVNSLAFLASRRYFDDTTFHRVVSGFFAQAGDPFGGEGGPGYYTSEEPTTLRNTRGTVVMAKDGVETRFGSQFFINLRDNTPLDADGASWRRYYPFGQVISGMEVADAIGSVAVDASEHPLTPVRVLSIRVTEE